MTLLVIRDAEKSVRQISVPKLLIVSVPIAALLSLSGIIVNMQLKSVQHIHELEGKLDNQTLALDITVKDKDEAIRKLQNEIIRLSAEADSVKSKVAEMSDLEAQLEQFADTYLEEDGSKPSPILSRTTADWNATRQVGGEALDASNEELIQLAQESSFELKEVYNLLHTMETSMSSALNKAIDKQALIDATPSYWPTTSSDITSSFGYRRDPFTGRAAFHAGIDIGGKLGDPVYAAADGDVIEAGFNSSRGNYIVIRHSSGLDTWYMHLSRIDVKENQEVKKSEPIGTIGSTGRSTGAHLHFEIVQNGQTINPLPYMEASPDSTSERIRS